jgi:glutamine amidotransferase-like uncharacterized protein
MPRMHYPQHVAVCAFRVFYVFGQPAHAIATLFILTWVAIYWHSSFRRSPSIDELAHIVAGRAIVDYGDFGLYSVNPPLVRIIAAVPCVSLEVPCLTGHDADSFRRAEWDMANRMVRANSRDDLLRCVGISRLALLPIHILGAISCWHWLREIGSTRMAMAALLLWLYSPMCIAWSPSVCPDASAASLGIAASYAFWKWLVHRSWSYAVIAGVGLGVLLLTKTTWIAAWIGWPVVWGMSLVADNSRRCAWGRQVGQLFVTLALSVYVVNVGFGFIESLRPLGDYTFASRKFAGSSGLPSGGRGGNRFLGSAYSNMLVPLPRAFIQGIDLQQLDFESRLPSYCLGTWQRGGWWYYYILCGCVKLTAGSILLLIMAVLIALRHFAIRRTQSRNAGVLFTKLYLGSTATLIVVVVSAHYGVNQHFRYVLPAIPLAVVWIAAMLERVPRLVRPLKHVLITWSTVSSLWIYPHSLAYFNEFAGGPLHGHRILLHSSYDCDQDLGYLTDWCRRYADEIAPQCLFRYRFSDHLCHQVGNSAPPPVPMNHRESAMAHDGAPWQMGPRPGWFACSVHRICEDKSRFSYFDRLIPAAYCGYSYRVYNVTLDQANSIRRDIGLAQIPDFTVPEKQLIVNLAAKSRRPLSSSKVAVFEASTANNLSKSDVVRVIDANVAWQVRALDATALCSRTLNQVDVIVVPGGSGREMGVAMEELGRASIREFVANGGGYVGICGGAYLATSEYPWGLALVNVRTMTGNIEIDGKSVSLSTRGRGVVDISITEVGRLVLGTDKSCTQVHYAGGPIFLNGNRMEMSRPIPLAMFASEIWRVEAQRNTMIDTPAIIAAKFGKGTVVLFSPHIESGGSDDLLSAAIHIAAR